MSLAPEPNAVEALLARQAIVDVEERVVGYELLYRGPRRPDGRPASEAGATSEVIWNAWMRLGRREVGAQAPLWLNVGREYLERTPAPPLHPDEVVLELCELDAATPDLIARIRQLRRDGYRIALDDFELGGPQEALLACADVVKLDVLQYGIDGVVAAARELRGCGALLVAEKVEHREDLPALRAAGFSLYQGYFYEQPKVVHGRRLPLRAIASLRTMADVLAAGDDLAGIEAVVADDPVQVFRMLRLANSGYYGTRRPVETLHDALTRIGSRAAREWLTMMLLHGVSDPRHPALVTAVARARLCASLAEHDPPDVRDRCFLIGLLSALDAVVAPLPQLLREARLGPQIANALLHRTGREGQLLAWAIALQHGTIPEELESERAAATSVAAEAYATDTLAQLAVAA